MRWLWKALEIIAAVAVVISALVAVTLCTGHFA
jgi:hypothetical protein